MLYSEGKHLIHVSPSLNHQGFISLYQLISSAMHDGKSRVLYQLIWAFGLVYYGYYSQVDWVLRSVTRKRVLKAGSKGQRVLLFKLSMVMLRVYLIVSDAGLSAYALGQLRQDDKIIMNLDGIDIEFKRQHLQKIWAKDWLTV